MAEKSIENIQVIEKPKHHFDDEEDLNLDDFDLWNCVYSCILLGIF